LKLRKTFDELIKREFNKLTPADYRAIIRNTIFDNAKKPTKEF